MLRGSPFRAPMTRPRTTRFSFGYLFDFWSVSERDHLAQDLVEERLEVLTSFGSAAWVSGLPRFELAMHGGTAVADLRWRIARLLCNRIEVSDGHLHRSRW
jgi:hypothetical protein